MSLENYKEYPCLIYEPYSKTLKEDDPQRKDHQRICLEMILAYNASICLGKYYYYNQELMEEPIRSSCNEILE